MDEFKKYLQQYRDDLDTDLPDLKNWERVKKTLHPKPVIHLYKKWIAAACVIIAAGLAIFFFTNDKTAELATGAQPHTDTLKDQPAIAGPQKTIPLTNNGMKDSLRELAAEQNKYKENNAVAVDLSKQQQPVAKRKKAPKIKATAPVYGFENVEASYASMLDLQLEQLRRQPIYGESAEYFDLFKKQFEDLGREEEKIKKDFRKTEDKILMLDRLILVYQRKISILKQLQFEINKMNNKVKQTDTGIPMQKPSYIHL